MRIGVFGGSFNPVHNGHLALAQAALSELNLDRILFVPSYRTPLKPGERLMPAAFRVRLLRAALKGRRRMGVCLYEIKRRGTSYTVDTLRTLKRAFGPEGVFYFLCGADTLRHFSRWKKPHQVLRLCRFVVMTRPAKKKAGLQPAKKKAGLQPASNLGGRRPSMISLPFAALPISASDIRRRLRQGKSLNGLVPKAVERMLAKDSGRR